MTRYEPFVSLALAAAAGLLIGLERERSAPASEREGSFLGGARTHPMLALVGAVATVAAHALGAGVVLVALGALVLLLLANYAGDVVRDVHRGITSEAAFLLSFLLGVLSATQGVFLSTAQKVLVVSAVAVVATFLLSAKATLHPFVRRVSSEDVAGTLKFLVVAVVVVPLLPDEAVGPLRALNPFQIGLLAVVISGISFVGYAGVRLLGPERGLGLTGVVGGLVSSTAVTVSMAGRAKARPEIAGSAALAVILASAIMFARILAIVAFVNPALERHLALSMTGGLAGGAVASAVIWFRSRRTGRDAAAVAVSNPFELQRALQFALAFAVILIASKAAALYLGTAGTYATGLVAGTTDVDAISLSMAKLAGSHVTFQVAATTVFLAAASNTISKGVLAVALGGWPFGRVVLAGQALMLAAGAIGLAIGWGP